MDQMCLFYSRLSASALNPPPLSALNKCDKGCWLDLKVLHWYQEDCFQTRSCVASLVYSDLYFRAWYITSVIDKIIYVVNSHRSYFYLFIFSCLLLFPNSLAQESVLLLSQSLIVTVIVSLRLAELQERFTDCCSDSCLRYLCDFEANVGFSWPDRSGL